MEEYTIEVVVVVLACVSKDYIEVLAALVDDGSKTDDLRACTNNDTKLEFTVLLPLYIGVIKFGSFGFHDCICLFVIIYWIEICIWSSWVEDFVAVHDGNEILGV